MTQLKFNNLGNNDQKNYHHNEQEQFKQLRTNIEFSSLDSDNKVIVVTSADSAEAKSHTATNLAKAICSHKRKVLLIDCDLRIPDVHKVLRIPNRSGLSDVLIGKSYDEKTLTKHIQKVSVHDGINDLNVLTSGISVPSPLEFLSSHRFKDFISAVKEQYDAIIIDAPPVLPVADAIPVALASDAVLFCVAANQTNKERAQQAITTLQRAKANIIGTVLTMVESKANRYYYYNYNYHQNAKGRKSLGHDLKNIYRKRRRKDSSL